LEEKSGQNQKAAKFVNNYTGNTFP